MVPDHRVILGSLIAAAVALSSCAGGEADRPRAAGGPATVPVTVTKVVEKDMPLDVSAVGAVEAFATVAVRAQVTGELKAVNFRQGEDVQAGQVLFTLDPRPMEAALNQAEANLQRDTAQAANAKVIAQRMDDLVERGVGTREQRDTARTQAAALEAVVVANQAAVENAKVQLQYATIRAPISGRTGVLMVNAGNLVRANDQLPLVVINQVSPILVSFAVPEACFPTSAATWRNSRFKSRQHRPTRRRRLLSARSPSSTTRWIRPPARFGSRPRSPTATDVSGPGSS